MSRHLRWRSSAARKDRRNLAPLTIAGIVAIATSCSALSTPPYVDHIVIANPSPYTLLVDVRGGKDDGWLNLGESAPHSERQVSEVLDEGPVWIFRFKRVSGPAQEVIVRREDLASSGWRVSAPQT
jgi:hypothetical protein